MRKVPAIIDCVDGDLARILYKESRLIDTATNRDFSLLVVLLALIGKLDLFLWMAGIGVHLFWITALCSQWRDAGCALAISEKSA